MMRSSVPYFYGTRLNIRTRRVIGYQRCKLPGMPWFRCFTNRFWRAWIAGPVFTLTEESSGFAPYGAALFDDRVSAIREAYLMLEKRPRCDLLASVALAATVVKPRMLGVYRKRKPQHWRKRTR